MTCISRFTLGAAAVLLFLPGTLRAGGDIPPAIDGLSARAPDNQGSPDSEMDVFRICVVKSCPGLEASASLLFLQPSTGNMVYATVVNPFPFLTPHWSDQAVNPDFSPAFNIGMRYIGDGGGDIRLDWTHLNSDDNAATHVPFPYPAGASSGPSYIQSLGPSFLIGPPSPLSSASAVAHFDYDAVNLDAGLLLSGGAGSHVQVRIAAGLQGARISQSLATNFLSSVGSIAFTDVPKSTFTGVGPRLGMDMHYVSGCLDLLGEIAGSTLIGGRTSRIDFVTTSPQTGLGLLPNSQSLTSPAAIQVVPCIDAKLGASYAMPVGKWGTFKCEAGYQAAVYINAVNQYSLSEVQNSLTTPFLGTAAVFLSTAVESQTNFFIHGPYLKFSLDF